MLSHVLVKNFALIEKMDVSFHPGLNILTGETGTGKSIIIDAVTLALGGKAAAQVIRQGADYAYIELVFTGLDEEKCRQLGQLDIYPEEGAVIVSRKIMQGRSVSKINDETVTAARLREATGCLIDIHGQHEHQSLLYKSRHLEILDEFSRQEIGDLKKRVQDRYDRYAGLLTELKSDTISDEARMRELDFCRYEIREIEEAHVKEGEEEELALLSRRYQNSEKIARGISEAMKALGYEEHSSAGEQVGLAVRTLQGLVQYDSNIEGLLSQAEDVEGLLNDLNRGLSDYAQDMVFDEEEYGQVIGRLDQIRSVFAKYGGNRERMMEYLEKKKERLQKLEHYEERRASLQSELNQTEKELMVLCRTLTEKRRQQALLLEERITKALTDLNFLHVQFEIAFTELSHFTRSGWDEVEFMISMNPGEPVKPLGQVASGGELSRIMLALKAVLADTDEIPTLIFDEIDAGISGRTAQKVSEKLAVIGRAHQVLCITHLPQIAAMADYHYGIDKKVQDGKVISSMHLLNENEKIDELARLLGGAQITDMVRKNAEEMKLLADNLKKKQAEEIQI